MLICQIKLVLVLQGLTVTDCLDPLLKKDKSYINQTKLILGMAVAPGNNKPFLSNTSLVCHNHCNHIFPEILSPNIG